MPTYEYHCDKCGATYDKREGFDAPSNHTCEKCGAEARRVLRVPAIVFKGSGFYATDSRKGVDGGGENAASKKAETPASDDAAAPTPAPAADHGHGHSHGPGGHTH